MLDHPSFSSLPSVQIASPRGFLTEGIEGASRGAVALPPPLQCGSLAHEMLEHPSFSSLPSVQIASPQGFLQKETKGPRAERHLNSALPLSCSNLLICTINP